MEHPIVDRDLGVIILYASLYSYTNEIAYKIRAEELFRKAVEVFPLYDFAYSSIDGFEGIFLVVTHLRSCNILDNEDSIVKLRPYLKESIEYDLNTDNFNFLHGCLGKLQYYLYSNELDSGQSNEIIDKVIDSLYDKRIEQSKSLNWNDENYNVDFDFKFVNGHTGLLNFLLHLKDKGCNHSKLTYLIEKLLHLLLELKDKPKQVSIRGVSQEKNTSDYFNITEYHGDLTIAYSLFYAGNVLKREELKAVGTDLVLKVCNKEIGNSGIMFFSDYSFYDISLTSGLSGVVFLLYKLNSWIDNSFIEKSITLWKHELEKHTLKVLSIEEQVLMPNIIQNKKGNYYYNKYSLLEGILGSGLVLSYLEYDKNNWSKFLAYY